MCLTRAVSVITFFGALFVGVASVWFVEGPLVPASDDMSVAMVEAPAPRTVGCATSVGAHSLVGHWKGRWGYWDDHQGVTSTLDIDRVRGEKFYGTLSQNGAKIAFEGTFDPFERRVYFNETKVLKLGIYPEWLLGTNHGSLSDDTRILSGAGQDSYSGYDWDFTKVYGDWPED
jgi:hypothetical protein